MTFEEILDQAIAMLQRRGRVTYQTLRLQFQLDEEHLRPSRMPSSLHTRKLLMWQAAAWSGVVKLALFHHQHRHPLRPWSHLSHWLPALARRPSHHPNRTPLRPNVANSPCCFVIWWIRRCWPASSTRKSCAR
jgi:hypothetical protein